MSLCILCRSVRANVEYDSARLIKFSPDNKSFITSLENANAVRVFKIGKNADGSLGKVQAALDFEKVSLYVVMLDVIFMYLHSCLLVYNGIP